MTTTPPPNWYLPINDMQPRRLYRVGARNFRYGIWNPDTQGFIGIRTKFGRRYLFTEDHWDTGPPHGTAKPYRTVEDVSVPDDIPINDRDDNTDLFEWLDTIVGHERSG